jgi:nitroimidazol reductase NimA-like FMN-containing flavoprotein (pyridoxamine 5'-phosphate oxidase superfamily)
MKTMRRQKQQLSQQECLEILHRNTSGVLALLSQDGYTYAVPLSYVYHDGHIYFHSNKEGEKIDAIDLHNKVSFAITDQDLIVPEGYTTLFKSVICFGTISKMDEPEKMAAAMELLCAKYSPVIDEQARMEHSRNIPEKMAVLDLKIEGISGKQSSKLLKMQQGE